MKTSCLLLLVSFSVTFANAQFVENFNSGSFSSPNVWQGSTAFFNINTSNQLQSNGPNATSILSLSTISQALERTLWQCWLKMDFESSTSNYCKIVLAATTENIQDPNMEAYYLKVGGLSGNTDGIDLYYQKGSTHTRIIKGIEGRVGALSNSIRLKVLRDDLGNWFLYSDNTGDFNFELEGFGVHYYSFSSQRFGFLCMHTSTRRDKFYIDDVLVDNNPFFIRSIHAIDKNTLVLNFNMIVKAPLQKNSFTIDGKALNDNDSLEIDGHDIFIRLGSPLNQGVHDVYISSVKSMEGNDLVNAGNSSFSFIRTAKPNELLITEIMADPDPAVGLPVAEYVEIYNATNDTLNLLNYYFQDPMTKSALPAFQLHPKHYLVLTSAANAPAFAVYGNVLALPSWPTLNNDKDTLRLVNTEGLVLHEVVYNLNDFTSVEKKAGGWAMEMIHLNNYCSGISNWDFSESNKGGTPAKVNSMEDRAKDKYAPKIESVVCNANQYWKIGFDEVLDTLRLPKIMRQDVQSFLKGTFADKKTLLFTLPVKQGSSTWVEIQHIKDCIGNSGTIEVELQNPRAPQKGELWINEVLYNPYAYGKDFIELYNSSPLYISLAGLVIQNSAKQKCVLQNIVINPQSYKVLTVDSMAVKQFYSTAAWGTFVKSNLPSLSDSSGSVGLMNAKGDTLDFMLYHENMQHPFLESKDGYSLERVSINQASLSESNWVSASINANGASPGYKNTQSGKTTKGGSFYIEPQTISPGMDGYRNFAHIYFQTAQPGTSVKADIFSLAGNWVCSLLATGPSGVNGMCTWDGTNDRKEVVATGLYVVILDFLEVNGTHYKQKSTIGVVSY